MSEDIKHLNLVRALELGLIDWFGYFEILRSLDAGELPISETKEAA